ncbi:hypothetical protein F5051DRAFT_426622 [Lentinula edodes]|nr:hypothetical protein F5051DRAFT_426622 [Lentinula edodes]
MCFQRVVIFLPSLSTTSTMQYTPDEVRYSKYNQIQAFSDPQPMLMKGQVHISRAEFLPCTVVQWPAIACLRGVRIGNGESILLLLVLMEDQEKALITLWVLNGMRK